jgi:hypothetical protein
MEPNFTVTKTWQNTFSRYLNRRTEQVIRRGFNNVSAWMATDSIVSIPNRLLRYESNMFIKSSPK